MIPSTPRLEQRSAQPFVAIRMQVPIPFGQYLGPAWQEVSAWLAQRGAAPAGAPIIRYITTDMSQKLEIEVGFPTSTPLPGDERISSDVFPAGRYAVLSHFGPYDGLVQATASLLAWADQHGVTWQTSHPDGIEHWRARFESYPTDPDDQPDPAKWQTEIIFLTAESA